MSEKVPYYKKNSKAYKAYQNKKINCNVCDKIVSRSSLSSHRKSKKCLQIGVSELRQSYDKVFLNNLGASIFESISDLNLTEQKIVQNIVNSYRLTVDYHKNQTTEKLKEEVKEEKKIEEEIKVDIQNKDLLKELSGETNTKE